MKFILVLLLSLSATCVSAKRTEQRVNAQRAATLLDSLVKYYHAYQAGLFYENYPNEFVEVHYLASKDTVRHNRVAYLWPTSGVFSGVNALLRATGDRKYKKMLETTIIPGLQQYYDTTRKPCAYASYITKAGHSDRFYDDNVWLGLDFIETWQLTGKKEYLNKAKEIWEFLMSGCDDVLGGGIYWCEQKKGSKNTCSNAPAAVMALRMFEATHDSLYFKKGMELYDWTKKNLQDKDYLYFDNVGVNGNIGRAKYAYNTGQMLQATALLYKLTGNKEYLVEAQKMAEAGVVYFGEAFKDPKGKELSLFRKKGVWFVAIMFRGYAELYRQDHDPRYLRIFQDNLDQAWNYARYDNGLINADWAGKNREKHQELLTQGAMVEMYAALAALQADKK